MTRLGSEGYRVRNQGSDQASAREVNKRDNAPSILSPRPLFEAFQIGAWWDMEILERRGNTYLVHFEGYGRHEEQEVPSNLIRLRSRKAESADCPCLIRGADVVVFAVHPHASRSGSNLSLYSAWYDAKIVSKEYKRHISACACKFEVKFYSECPKNIETEKKRILLEGTEMELSIDKLGIMQAAIESSLDRIIEETFLLSQKDTRRQWSRDTYTMDLSFSSQGYLHSTTKKISGTTLVDTEYKIPVIDLTTDIIREEEIAPPMLEDDMSECLKDVTKAVESDTQTETNSGAQLVDSTVRQNDGIMQNCSARGFSGDSCGNDKSGHVSGRKRTRTCLPRKAKVVNGAVYAKNGRGLKHARRTGFDKNMLFCSSDESSSSYRYSRAASDCDESDDSDEEDYTTDHNLSRSTPVFHGGMSKDNSESKSTEIFFEGKSKSTEIFLEGKSNSTETFYEDEDKDHKSSESTRTFYGNSGRSTRNSNSTEVFYGPPGNIGLSTYSTELNASSDCSHNVQCRACESLGVENSISLAMPASSQGESSNKDHEQGESSQGESSNRDHAQGERSNKDPAQKDDIKMPANCGRSTNARKPTFQRSAIPHSHRKAKTPRVEEGKNGFNDLFEIILKGVHELGQVKGRVLSEKQVFSVEERQNQIPWDPIIFHEKEDLVLNFEATVDDDPLTGMWGDMESAFEEMQIQEMGVATPPLQYDQPRKEDCEHYFVLNEAEGYVCSHCGLLETSIENILAPIKEDKVHRSERDGRTENEVDAFEATFNDSKEHQNISRKPLKSSVDSVWKLIPELKSQMHKNQIDGFSFLWENIGALSSQNDDGGGGCIIAHAPGTGKSLLIIGFLKSVLLMHSWCRPLIVAPKPMLLLWQKEFQKWNTDIKVHLLQSSRPSLFNYLKIISEWQHSTSVLIVTYQLFSKLTDEERACRKPENRRVGGLLLHIPDILVMDEGHVARNCSKLRESLLQVRTRFKILMSGTLFQNNFRELFNLLHLARPEFLNYLQARGSGNKSLGGLGLDEEDHNKQWQSFEDFESERWSRRATREQAEVILRNIFMEEIGNKLEVNVEKNEGAEFKRAIDKLREITFPFIHFYDGEILKTLPGLKEFIVVLQATRLQVSLSTRIKHQDYIETSLSIHPSILLRWPATRNCNFLDIDELKAIRGDVSQGPKVKFILDLAHCCQTLKEKLLIFTQYRRTLEFVKDVLEKKFKVVEITGKNIAEERQRVMDMFNDSEGSLILLATLTACGEGINLTGASRVVFLDMHWNPARMKQAEARAFRIGQKRVVYVYWLIASMEKEANKFTRIQRKNSRSRSIFSSGIKDVIDCQSKERNSNMEAADIILDQLLKNDTSKSILEVVNYSALEGDNLSALLEHYAFSGKTHTYKLF